MKIAVIADCHVGNHKRYNGPIDQTGLNQRCRDTVKVLRHAFATAASSGAKEVIIAGDIFHEDRPSPAVVAAVIRVANEFAKWLVFRWVVGNHDRTSLLEDATLPLPGTRVAIPLSTVWAEYGSLSRLAMVPAGYEDPAGAAAQDPCDVIVAHHGIWDNTTPEFLRNTKGALSVEQVRNIMRLSKCRLYMAGDWHQHRVIDVPEGRIVQIGALCPTGFSDSQESTADSPYGSVYIVETFGATCERQTVPHPAFVHTVTEADRLHPYAVYTKSPRPWPEGTGDGIIKFIAEGATSFAKEAAAVRGAAAMSYSREDLMAAVVNAVAASTLAPDVQMAAVELLGELL